MAEAPPKRPADADQPAVVKKYANRRLYNTATSSYVTLDELSRMVRAGRHFVVYDAKTGGGFVPGGCSLHNTMLPHGPDRDAFEGASKAELKPHRLIDTMAFMFETRFPQRVTAFAAGIEQLQKDYGYYGRELRKHFDPSSPEPRW